MPQGQGQGKVVNGAILLEGDPHDKVKVVPPEGVKVLLGGAALEDGAELEVGTPVPPVELPSPPVGDKACEVYLAPDRHSALLRVLPVFAFRLADRPSENPLMLHVTVERRPHPDLSRELVLGYLAELGVVAGIDEAAVEAAVRELPDEPVTVARDVAPQPGAPGRLEVAFGEASRAKSDVRRDGSMEWRTTLEIPLVHPGDLLARVIPPTEGTPGRSIFGKELPAPRGKEMVVRAGPGTELGADGTEVRATAEGLPLLLRQGASLSRLEVKRAFVQNGNVCIATGNLSFADDIVVNGSVQQDTKVVAGGRVVIHGEVDRALVEGGQGVEVSGNAFSSTLRSGGPAACFAAMRPKLERLEQEVAALHAAVAEEAAESLTTDRLRDLVLSEHPELPRLVVEVAKECQGLPAGTDEELRREMAVIASLAKHLTEVLRVAGSVLDWDLGATAARLVQLADTVRLLGEAPATVAVRYAQGCTIVSGSDVVVQGAAFNCQITAAGTVTVRGTIRGGKVRGEKGIQAQEAGSKEAPQTVLETGTAGTIRLASCWPGVTLLVGPERYRFTAPGTNIHARLVERKLTLG